MKFIEMEDCMNVVRLATRIYLILLIFCLFGCAGPVKHMRPVSEEMAVSAPVDGKSLVVFMRPSTIGFTTQSSVHYLEDTTPVLIGIVAAKKKVSFETEPGEYIFMVAGENADFLSAEILANKTYYILIQPKLGIWNTRFYLQPIRFSQLDSEEFNGWLSDCEWVEKTPESESWANRNQQTVIGKYETHYPEWRAYDKSKRLALLPSDGI